MKTSHLGLLGLVLAAAPLSACNETAVGTDTVRTKGLWASFKVVSTGPSTTLTAELRVGGSGGTAAYPLTGADALLVSIGGGDETNLDETCREDNTFCTGNLGDISGKEVRVNFDRGSDVENAPSSTVKMPKAFDISVEDDEVVRGVEDVELSISGGSNSLRYKVSGSCIWTEEGTVTDGKIPASAITSPTSDVDEDCDVRVTVTRAAEGVLDPNFGKGGRIVAIQERTFTFFSLANPNPPVGSPDAGDTSTSDVTDTGANTSDAGDAGDDGGAVTEDAGADSGDGGSSSGSAVPDAATDVSTSALESSSTTSEESSSVGQTSSDVPASSEPADAGDAG